MEKTFSNKKRLALLGVVCIGVIIVVIYFNSSLHLKRLLTKNIWYEDVMEEILTSKSGSSEVLYFRVDGSGVSEDYMRYDYIDGFGEHVSNPQYIGESSFSWELLSDKTLYFRGNYYIYKDEWFFTGNNELNIGGVTYKSWNQCAYDKDASWLKRARKKID